MYVRPLGLENEPITSSLGLYVLHPMLLVTFDATGHLFISVIRLD